MDRYYICKNDAHPLTTVFKQQIQLSHSHTESLARLFKEAVDTAHQNSDMYGSPRASRDSPTKLKSLGNMCYKRLKNDIVFVEIYSAEEKISVAKQSLIVTVPEKLAFVGEPWTMA